jgi:aminoglycoside/choline kinase family phosphotransferase
VDVTDGSTVVVMDYGEAFESVTDDVRLNRVFAAAGLRVARILEISGEAGCLVVEDLGDELVEKRWDDRPAERRGLLERAIRLAADVAERGSPVLAASERREGPALDVERFRFEMTFFTRHYVVDTLGLAPSPELARELAELAELAAAPPRVLCHRDFHSRNLLVLPGGELGMVDIQDARWGPDTYDLASLLRDAYIEVPEEWIDPAIRCYLERLSEPPPEPAFRDRFELVSAQRMIKALGTFGYQVTVLGRPRYESAISRVVGRLRRWQPRSRRTRRVLDTLIAERVL